MKNNVLNLADYRMVENGQVSKVLVGKNWGKYVREHSRLDEMERLNESVTIIIPDGIYAITPSFFDELLVDVVKKLGRKDFQAKFRTMPVRQIAERGNRSDSSNENLPRLTNTPCQHRKSPPG